MHILKQLFAAGSSQEGSAGRFLAHDLGATVHLHSDAHKPDGQRQG